MTLDDFRAVILPALGKFELIDLTAVGPEDLELLWTASLPHGTWTPAVKHQVQDAQDVLLGRVPDITVKLVRELRTNYEALKAAAASGATDVRVVARNECRCLAPLDGVQLPVQRALAAFGGDSSVPLLPPPEVPCMRGECPRICSVREIPAGPASRPGDDPEFALVLGQILSPTSSTLPEDWSQRIADSGAASS